MLKKNHIIIITLIFVFYGCSTSRYSVDSDQMIHLRHEIDKIFTDTLFTHAHWGVLIKSLNTGETWYKLNSNKMFMPASNEKIPTTAATLMTLGPDFKFTTNLSYKGQIQDSILVGDLIVKSNGDPTLYIKFFDDPRRLFFDWADSLKKLGIKIISGNIIGDDDEFDNESIGNGWTFDGLDAWYSAEIGPLQLCENYIDINIIAPEEKDDDLKIEPIFKSDYFSITNQITLNDSIRTRINYKRPYGTNEIYLSGNLNYGSDIITVSPSITNPTLFYVTVLKEVLVMKNITVEGKPIDCDEMPDWVNNRNDLTPILVHYSPPLKDILSGLMKRSQNLYAETMVKTLGWYADNIGTFHGGYKIIEKILNEFGIEIRSFQYTDGSGLSRYNYISPEQIVKILTGMNNSQYSSIWKDLFPIAGVDGTLKNRMKGTSAAGNVKAKTGTISNVRALSGYVTTMDGEELVFSFLVNGHLRSARETEKITDSVLELLANFNRNI